MGRMERQPCSAPDCDKPMTYGRLGLCVMHYWRFRKHGSLDDPRPTTEKRFWAKVDKTEGCWLWTRALNSNGYGVFRVAGMNVYAHRYAYELLVGPIPDGLEPDHVKANGCTSTACVKAIADEHGPTHLEVVTHRVNTLRGDSPAAKQAKQTHCHQGHELTEANVYRRPGKPNKRECRTCMVEREARRVRGRKPG